MTRLPWVKLATDLHDNGKIRLAGRSARDVFVYMLCCNGLDGGVGVVHRRHLDARVIALKLDMTPGEAASALDALVEFELIERTPDDSAKICGWDEEWAPRPKTNAERQRNFRKRHGLRNDASRDVTESNGRNVDREVEGEREEEKNKSRKRAARAASVDPRATSLAMYLLEAIRSHTPDTTIRPEAANGWSRDIELMLRLDSREPDDVQRVIDFAHRDPAGRFWRDKVRCGEKLRKHFETLREQMQRGQEFAVGTGVHRRPEEVHVVRRPEPTPMPPVVDPREREAARAMVDQVRSVITGRGA